MDKYSRVTWLYLMKSRSELYSIFVSFVSEIQTQFGITMKILRTDNVKEYFSESFSRFMKQYGIIHESSCVDTPQQNGVAERKNRHLLEVTCTSLFEMHVPKPFWADLILTTCYLINRMSSSVLSGSIPYSVLFPSHVLFHASPRIFGCVCFVRDHCAGQSKLDPKALKCLFVGYFRTQKRYRCFSPDLNRYLVCRDVSFFENTPFMFVPHNASDLDKDLPTHIITTTTTITKSLIAPSRSSSEI